VSIGLLAASRTRPTRLRSAPPASGGTRREPRNG
jgi:hypothetical protein